MLVDCRSTCKQVFQGEGVSTSPTVSKRNLTSSILTTEFLQVLKLGGLEDNITDVLNLNQPLCSLSQVDQLSQRVWTGWNFENLTLLLTTVRQKKTSEGQKVSLRRIKG